MSEDSDEEEKLFWARYDKLNKFRCELYSAICQAVSDHNREEANQIKLSFLDENNEENCETDRLKEKLKSEFKLKVYSEKDHFGLEENFYKLNSDE
jgi:hypothetical protein